MKSGTGCDPIDARIYYVSGPPPSSGPAATAVGRSGRLRAGERARPGVHRYKTDEQLSTESYSNVKEVVVHNRTTATSGTHSLDDLLTGMTIPVGRLKEAYTYIYIYIYTHTHIHVCMYVRTYVRTYIHTYIDIYIYIYITSRRSPSTPIRVCEDRTGSSPAPSGSRLSHHCHYYYD